MFVSELQRVDRDTPGFPDGGPLTKATIDLAAPAAVAAMIKAQLRPNTSVILNAGIDGPLTRAGCLINRLTLAAADVMNDSGSAVPALVAKVPDILHWILEDHA